jgi:molybdate transport system permease protein
MVRDVVTPAKRVGIRRRPLQPRTRRLAPLILAALPLTLFLVVPLVALIVQVAPNRFLASVLNEQVVRAISLSTTTTALTTIITVVAGTPVAYLLARRSFPGRGLFDTVIDLQMVLPPSVAGIALLVAFGRQAPIGRLLGEAGIVVAFSPIAVVMAQTFVAAPFFVKAAVAGFAGADRELEQAAALERAGPLRVLLAVTVPLAAPSLLGGMIMTWARALGEFGATIIFAGNFPGRTQTMPLAIYVGFEINLDVALTLAAILLATSFLVLYLVKGALRQRIGAFD